MPLESIHPGGRITDMIDTIKGTIKGFVSWPFNGLITTLLRDNVSKFLKESTIFILDKYEPKVVEYITGKYQDYKEFRKDLEEKWEEYADRILEKLGFVPVYQGDGPAMVQFVGFPVESDSEDQNNPENLPIILFVVFQIAIPIIRDLISDWWNRQKPDDTNT